MAHDNIEEVIKKVILGENFLAENSQDEITEDEDTSDAVTLSEGDEDDMPAGDEDEFVADEEIVDEEPLEEAKDEEEDEDEDEEEEESDEEDEGEKKGKMPAFLKGKFGKKGKKEKVEEAASDYSSEKIAKTANGKTPKIAEPTDVSAEKNRSTIKAKPSDAKSGPIPSVKPTMKEDIAAMFSGEQLSEEFKAQAATLFEAHVNERVHQIEEQLKAQYEDLLEQHTVAVTEELVERIDDYLNYVVEEWMSENRLAIEGGLRTEITENFIANLKGLFAESYIEVPEDKLDLFESTVSEVENLDGELKTQVEKNIELSEEVEQLKCEIVFREIAEGLTDTEVEKLRRLAEDLEFDTVEQFAEKVAVLRENLDTIGSSVEDSTEVSEEGLEESYEEASEATPLVEAYARSLSRSRD